MFTVSKNNPHRRGILTWACMPPIISKIILPEGKIMDRILCIEGYLHIFTFYSVWQSQMASFPSCTTSTLNSLPLRHMRGVPALPTLELERVPVSTLYINPSLQLTNAVLDLLFICGLRDIPHFHFLYISVYTFGSFWFVFYFLFVWQFHLSHIAQKVGLTLVWQDDKQYMTETRKWHNMLLFVFAKRLKFLDATTPPFSLLQYISLWPLNTTKNLHFEPMQVRSAFTYEQWSQHWFQAISCSPISYTCQA